MNNTLRAGSNGPAFCTCWSEHVGPHMDITRLELNPLIKIGGLDKQYISKSSMTMCKTNGTKKTFITYCHYGTFETQENSISKFHLCMV